MSEFHFLRPLVLLCIPVLLACYLYWRRKLTQRKHMQSAIAPHLVAALTPRQRLADRFKPVDMVFAIALLLALAAAGPAWQKVVNDKGAAAPVVLVLKLSNSMLANDFQPTRLEYARQKIRDLLQLRAGAKTALIAYASTSHKVLPMTEDERVFLPFIEALSPDVMPANSMLADDAADALELAFTELERAGGGAVVLLADDIRPGEVEKIKAQATPFIWWQFATPGGGMIVSEAGNLLTDASGQTLALKLNETIEGELSSASAEKVTISNQDILAIDRWAKQQRRLVQQQNPEAPYRDMAWYFCWPALVLVAIWFRKGFTSAGSAIAGRALAASGVILTGALAGYAPPVKADALDWFLTPDQQAMIAYGKNDFAKAADEFADPMWRATAFYEQGKYDLAAQLFATVSGVDAMYNRANALLKAHSYPQAIVAYQQVLTRQPNHHQALRNKAIAERILKLLVDAGGNVDAEQSLSLEVDDRPVENVDENTKTQDFQVGDSLSMDAREQWMRSVNSDMSDFLSAKFANEAAQQGGEQ